MQPVYKVVEQFGKVQGEIYEVFYKLIKQQKYSCCRCGCTINKSKEDDKFYDWNGWKICGWCFRSKQSGFTNTIDLEYLDAELSTILKKEQDIKVRKYYQMAKIKQLD